MKRYAFLLMLIWLGSCKKDAIEPGVECEALQQGLMTNNVTLVEESLGQYLNKTYTKNNLEALAGGVTKDCEIKASVSCFDCIQTLPAQTEIIFQFTDDNRNSTTRVLDVTPSTENTIKVVGIHE